jgi:hypothetical protein
MGGNLTDERQILLLLAEAQSSLAQAQRALVEALGVQTQPPQDSIERPTIDSADQGDVKVFVHEGDINTKGVVGGPLFLGDGGEDDIPLEQIAESGETLRVEFDLSMDLTGRTETVDRLLDFLANRAVKLGDGGATCC